MDSTLCCHMRRGIRSLPLCSSCCSILGRVMCVPLCLLLLIFPSQVLPEPASTTPVLPDEIVPPTQTPIQTFRFGYDAIPREHSDHWNNSIYILHPSQKFIHDGYVLSWHVHVILTGNITFQVWRPIPEAHHMFRLVGQNTFVIKELGQQNFVAVPHKRIVFKKGDLIGVYFPQRNPIPFTKHESNCTHPTLYAHRIENIQVGRKYAFREREPGWNPCRIYSIYAEIVNGTNEYTSSPSVRTLPPPTTIPPYAATEPTTIDIKLENGRTAHEGLVYVRAPGSEWGTLCDDDWDDLDATVVCKQLAYDGGKARFPPFFGQGSGEIYLDDVQCNGTESHLVECDNVGGWGIHNCYHREDAGVECFHRHNESEHVFGYPAVPRSQKDMWDAGVYIPNPHESIMWAQGVITHWHFYIQTVATADVTLQVWRRQGPNEYFLVGQTQFRGLSRGRHDKELSPHERIQFEAGDVIGMMFSQFNPIPYDIDKTDCAREDGILYLGAKASLVTPGRVFTFQQRQTFFKPCRMYSLYAEFETAEQSANYQFSYGLSEYMVVADVAATQDEALRRCRQMLGNEATLLNITSEEEYNVINTALSAMDIDGASVFWVGGFVNGQFTSYTRWADCEPAKGRECIVLSNFEQEQGTYSDKTFRMFSKRCYESYKFICELVKPGPPTLPPVHAPTLSPRPSTTMHVYNSTSTEVRKQKTVPPVRSTGVLAGVIVVVIIAAIAFSITGVLIYRYNRRCQIRRLGPNDHSESTVRFVSLYDKAPVA